MDAYYARLDKEEGLFTFLFDGNVIVADRTPGELGMEDQDQIDVVYSVNLFTV